MLLMFGGMYERSIECVLDSDEGYKSNDGKAKEDLFVSPSESGASRVAQQP